MIAALGMLDLSIVVAALVVMLGVGLAYRRVAGKGLGEYFGSGRRLSWWMIGTSMSASSPMAAVAPYVMVLMTWRNGPAMAWYFLGAMVAASCTAMVFAKLWYRAGVTNDVALLGMRYDGVAARVLRSVKALVLVFGVYALVIGWLAHGLATVLADVTPVDPVYVLAGLAVLALAYVVVGGQSAVVATGQLQFGLALVGSIVCAVFVVDAAGGPAVLGDTSPIESSLGSVPLPAVLVGWCCGWPGFEPGGGGLAVQRGHAAFNERQARQGLLWAAFATFVVRPIPWLVVAVVANRHLLPEARVAAAVDGSIAACASLLVYVPEGALGLVVAGLVASFLGVVGGLWHLSSDYLLHEVWLPWSRGETDRVRLRIARVGAVVAALGALAVWPLCGGVIEQWQWVLLPLAGTAPVLVLRWFWWRINAWTELSALVASLVVSIAVLTWPAEPTAYLFHEPPLAPWYGGSLLSVVLGTAAVWLPVTFFTAPVANQRLIAFFHRVRPAGLWRDVPEAAATPRATIGREIGMWLAVWFILGGSFVAIERVLRSAPDAWPWDAWLPAAVALASLAVLAVLIKAEHKATPKPE